MAQGATILAHIIYSTFTHISSKKNEELHNHKIHINYTIRVTFRIFRIDWAPIQAKNLCEKAFIPLFMATLSFGAEKR